MNECKVYYHVLYSFSIYSILESKRLRKGSKEIIKVNEQRYGARGPALAAAARRIYFLPFPLTPWGLSPGGAALKLRTK